MLKRINPKRSIFTKDFLPHYKEKLDIEDDIHGNHKKHPK